MSDKVYLDNLQTFYSERLKAGLKKRFMKCSGCSGNKQFIINQGKLYFTCGSSSGECGLQFSIDLAEYIFLPELKEAYNSVQLTINKSKHPDIYSASEIKKYEEFVSYIDSELKLATKEFIKINDLKERQTKLQTTHKERINLKKEQNLLMDKLNQETDTIKKKQLMQDYIVINQKLVDSYSKLDESCKSINNFIQTKPGKIDNDNRELEQEDVVDEEQPVIDKNLIPELQGIVKEPKNKYTMNVIVAYRDPGDGSREAQLKEFTEQMNLLFDDQTDLRIYIIEQESHRDDYGSLPELIRQPDSDMAKFNLGVLKNIGFHLARKDMKKNKNAYYILSDVDLLPSMNLVKDYLRFPNNPIHLANKGTRYNMDGSDRNFLGGVVSINEKDFIKANGYPNNFWGWGGEDNALNYRLLKNKLIVDKPDEPVIDLEKLSLTEKLDKLKRDKTKELRKREKLQEDKQSWKTNGLTNLESHYKIVNKTKKDNLMHYKVYLQVD